MPHLPRNISLPTTPRLRQVLQNSSCFVLLNAFRHHIHYIVHDRSAQFQVKVRFNSLFCDCFSHSFGMASLELTREEVAEPSFQQRRNASHKKQPHTPTGCPEAATRSFAHRSLQKSMNNNNNNKIY